VVVADIVLDDATSVQAEVAEMGRRSRAVHVDVTDRGSVKAMAAEAVSEYGRADILVNNNGGPPPGRFEDWEHEQWLAALESNLLAPAALIRALLPGMRERRFGRIVNITSAAVRSPIDELCLSNGARCGLTGFVAGLSRKTVANNVTINNLLPGPFDTDRLRGNIAHRAGAAGISEAEMAAKAAANNPAGRFGTAEEFGAACAFLCSVHTGFITGQQILMDGGAFPGTM
ncbi:MAG: SDR family oxidoreductase, partial [Alphaproteobacteria bacterium]|nr:SDR family oxidoreductase [Alphaproteobacteria bacterium]